MSSIPLLITPGEYLCLSKNIDHVKQSYPLSYEGNYLLHTSLPALSDQGGTILLINRSGDVIDKARFSDDIHTTIEKDRRGISLERISSEISGLIESNWKSSNTSAGFATPGMINSPLEIDNESDKRGFWLLSPIIMPESTTEEAEARLAYSFDKSSDVKASVSIYDRDGNEVKQLLLNSSLSGDGLLKWDGRSSEGRLMSTGIYIILIEYHDQRSRVVREKISITLLKQ